MSLEDLKVIRGKIKERNHSWSAGSTSMSELPLENRKKRLGLIVTEEEKGATKIKIAEEEAIAAHKGVSFRLLAILCG